MSSGLNVTLTILATLAGSPMAPAVNADTLHEPPAVRPGSGPSNPVDVVLPPGLQGSFFRSLPIAGLLVTPDDIAAINALDTGVRGGPNQDEVDFRTFDRPIPE